MSVLTTSLQEFRRFLTRKCNNQLVRNKTAVLLGSVLFNHSVYPTFTLERFSSYLIVYTIKLCIVWENNKLLHEFKQKNCTEHDGFFRLIPPVFVDPVCLYCYSPMHNYFQDTHTVVNK